jgi:hypothetical protein
MAYCPKCGVELGAEAKACPLCGTRIEKKDESGAVGEGGESEVERLPTRPRKQGARAVEILSVLAGIATVLDVGIDLYSSGGFSWSPIAIVAMAMVWLAAAMPLILKGKPWLVFAALAPGELALLFLIDVFDRAPWWFFRVGMPIYLVSLGLSLAVVVLTAISKRRSLNVAGFVLVGAALECLAIEIILALAAGQAPRLVWSPIVALACVPAAGLLIYLHYRVVNKPLRRKLHL